MTCPYCGAGRPHPPNLGGGDGIPPYLGGGGSGAGGPRPADAEAIAALTAAVLALVQVLRGRDQKEVPTP